MKIIKLSCNVIKVFYIAWLRETGMCNWLEIISGIKLLCLTKNSFQTSVTGHVEM